MLTEKRLREIIELAKEEDTIREWLIEQMEILTDEIRRQRAQIKKLKRKVETLKEALR